MSKLSEHILFNKKQRLGISLTLIITLSVYGYNYIAVPKIDQLGNHESLESILKKRKVEIHEDKVESIKSMKSTQYKKSKKEYKPKKFDVNLFDPNTIDSSTMVKYGLPPWTIKTLLKYRSKGGTFKKCDDLKKIFNLGEADYNRLLPHCNVAAKYKTAGIKKKRKKSYVNNKETQGKDTTKLQNNTNKEFKSYAANKNPAIRLDLSTADTTQLMLLKGIGTLYANKIVEHRELLGGYRSIDQLLELWNFDTIVYNEIKENLYITAPVRKTNVNTVEFKQLLRHPYVDFNTAKIILNYRKHHGPYKKIEDIKLTRLISDSLFLTLEPYFDVK